MNKFEAINQPEIQLDSELISEQEALERDERELEAMRHGFKAKVGKLINIGYGLATIFSILVSSGALEQAKAEVLKQEMESGKNTTVLVEGAGMPEQKPSVIESNSMLEQMVQPNFNELITSVEEEGIKDQIKNLLDINLDKVDILSNDFKPDQYGDVDVNPEAVKIIQDYHEGIIKPIKAITSLLYIISENPQHQEVLRCIRLVSEISLEHGLSNIGQDIFKLYCNKYAKYIEPGILEIDLNNLFRFFNIEAGEFLRHGDVESARNVYRELLSSTTPAVADLAFSHIQALDKLPHNFAELNDVDKKIAESIAYGLASPEFNNITMRDDIEDVNDFIGKFKKTVKENFQLDSLRQKAENLLDVSLSEEEPIFRIIEVKDAAGEYTGNNNSFIPDTIKVAMDFIIKQTKVDYQLDHTNIPKEGLIDLRDKLHRNISTIIAHEKFHNWGYFKTIFGGEDGELFAKDGGMKGKNFTEGLTDLLARYLNQGEEELLVGYPGEAANWANIAYILGYKQDKDNVACFNDGMKILASSFLEEHSIKPIVLKMAGIANNPDDIFLMSDLLRNDNLRNNGGMILHADKTKQLVLLSEHLGIDLTKNTNNLIKLGLGRQVIQGSFSKEDKPPIVEEKEKMIK